MKLSANFTLSELTKSQTAVRKGIPNNPNEDQIDNLKLLCQNILQPIRSEFEKPILVSSGFRTAELCIAIGSSINSQHAKGEAADFEIWGMDNKELAWWIKNNLEYDQLILNSKNEAKNYFNKAREKILKDVDKKRESLEKEINEEINKVEKEILDLKNKSPEKIRKIAAETSSDLIKQLIGVEVNNSSISAIVEDVTRKTN